MEECADIVHEFVEVEVDANCALKLLDFILFKQELMVRPRRDISIIGLVGGGGQGLYCLDYQVSREVGAHETDHLVIIQGSDDFIVRGRVEDFLHLLQERFPVELSRRHECVLSE